MRRELPVNYEKLIPEAQEFERHLQGYIDGGKAQNFTEAEKQLGWDFYHISLQYPSPAQHDTRIDIGLRNDLYSEIYGDLKNKKGILIRGLYGLGKTTAVIFLAQRYYGGEKNNLIRIDGRNPDYDNLVVDDFAREIGFSEVKWFISSQSYHEGKREEIERDSGVKPLEFLEQWLAKRNRKVLLCLDEAYSYAEDPQKLEYIKSLVPLPHVDLVVVGDHRSAHLEQNFSTYFKDFRQYTIGGLTLEDTSRLVRLPIAGSGVMFTDDAVNEIHEVTGGYPREIISLCIALMGRNLRGTNAGKNLNFTYTAEEIKWLFNISRDDFHISDDGFYEVFADAKMLTRLIYRGLLSSDEQIIVKQLAKRGGIPTKEIDPQKVDRLEEMDLVIKDKKRRKYRIKSRIYERFFREHNIDEV
ncbi:hypothetical protein HYT02_00500 [Candidatus Gottesmanbacteria bacterium]|nr:hypothetical protein [Candidatus Gottesmanbacteria bacterium]